MATFEKLRRVPNGYRYQDPDIPSQSENIKPSRAPERSLEAMLEEERASRTARAKRTGAQVRGKKASLEPEPSESRDDRAERKQASED